MKTNTLFFLNSIILLCFALLSFSIISGRAAKQKSHSEKLKNSLKTNYNKDPGEPKSTAGNDSTLQITGDGSVYEHKQIKVSKDDGKTYKTIHTYEVSFNRYRVSSLYVFFFS